MKGIARLIHEPVILFNRDGFLLDMNRQAKELLKGFTASHVSDMFASVDGLRDLMIHSSGTSEPVVGAISFKTPVGEHARFRVRAVVTHRSDTELEVAVQLLDTQADKFAALSHRVLQLNNEIVARRAVQARLEEALEHNSILYRELQHRVKNHLQMMLGLFATARRETPDLAHRAVIENLEMKMRAICEAQQLMYMQNDAASVLAADLLSSLVRIFRTIAWQGVEIAADADPVKIPNDAVFPLSLILNELLSNSLKYGATGPGGRVDVTLRQTKDGLELRIQDNGPGFTAIDASKKRSSGLGLVRGLCRQLGAQLEIGSGIGGLVIVRCSIPR